MGDLKLNGATSGTITLTPAAVAGTTTITLPATTGTVVVNTSPTFTGTVTFPGSTTIDSFGNLGVGTTSTGSERVSIQENGGSQLNLKSSAGVVKAYIGTIGALGTAPTNALRIRSDEGGIYFGYQGAIQAAIDTSSNLQFNSGFGTSATAYGCRAWVNFDGSTASPSTRRGSGNVSSVTKNGTGDYTLNFASAMPDANYAVVFGCGSTSTGAPNAIGTIYNTAGALTTTTARIWTGASNSAAANDWTQVTCSIFR